MRMAIPNGTAPPSLSVANTAALNPMTEATDKSISPAMITNVIITTMITFSIDSSKRLTKLSMSR